MSDTHSSDLILTDVRDSVAVITFNSPATRNALSTEMQNCLERIVTDLTSRRDMVTLIFTGREKAFLAGANIRELSQLDQRSASAFSERGQRLFQNIAQSGRRTIAAINGFCMGGGLDFALACDIRVAAPNAEFAHPGARLGIITGWGGTQRLPRLIGRTRAIEFFVTARRLVSHEALKIGLITRICDPVIKEAMVLANK